MGLLDGSNVEGDKLGEELGGVVGDSVGFVEGLFDGSEVEGDKLGDELGDVVVGYTIYTS